MQGKRMQSGAEVGRRLVTHRQFTAQREKKTSCPDVTSGLLAWRGEVRPPGNLRTTLYASQRPVQRSVSPPP